MDLSALRATGEMLGGHPRLFFTPWTTLSLFSRLKSAGLLPEEFPPMGSVGLSAAAIACRLSSGPVIVAGMDFSFTLDLSHARSSPAHLEKLRRQTRLCSPIDPAGAFRKGCFAAPSKTGETVRSNQTMQNYRDLFQREFARPPGESGRGGRVRDVIGSGLDLVLETLGVEAACAVLAGGRSDADGAIGGRTAGSMEEAAAGPGNGAAAPTRVEDTRKRMADFIRAEIAALQQLRGILAGVSPAGESADGAGQLGALLDRCDYLWAHLPGCAGAGGRRPAETDLGFLKQTRAEIDPFVKVWETALAHCRVQEVCLRRVDKNNTLDKK
jgi:hypothetical protein